jgi:hypothetical protein
MLALSITNKEASHEKYLDVSTLCLRHLFAAFDRVLFAARHHSTADCRLLPDGGVTGDLRDLQNDFDFLSPSTHCLVCQGRSLQNPTFFAINH